MKIISSLKKILLFFSVILFCSVAFAQDDPDLPKHSQSIDKETYLKARADYIARKRGLPHDLPYEPRIKAIEEKIRQEIDARNNPNIIALAPNWVAEGPFPIPNGQTTGAVYR